MSYFVSIIRWQQSSLTNVSRQELAMPKSKTTRLGFPFQIYAADWEGWIFNAAISSYEVKCHPNRKLDPLAEKIPLVLRHTLWPPP